MAVRKRTKNQQMGDAGERLVAAELALAGIRVRPTVANWANYDLVALGKKEGNISVLRSEGRGVMNSHFTGWQSCLGPSHVLAFLSFPITKRTNNLIIPILERDGDGCG